MLCADLRVQLGKLLRGGDGGDNVADLLPVCLDALGVEGLEHVVLVLLEYAVGERAELIAHPRLVQRLKGLDLDGVALGVLVIRPRAHDSAHAHALAVHTVRALKALGLHLHKVGDKVLRAGGGAAVGEYLHR